MRILRNTRNRRTGMNVEEQLMDALSKYVIVGNHSALLRSETAWRRGARQRIYDRRADAEFEELRMTQRPDAFDNRACLERRLEQWNREQKISE
jgi:hypothetical protein